MRRTFHQCIYIYIYIYVYIYIYIYIHTYIDTLTRECARTHKLENI